MTIPILLVKGEGVALFTEPVVGLGFKDDRGQVELFFQLLLPLFAERGREDQEDSPSPFGPSLGQDDSGLNGLPQANLIGKDYPLGQRRPEGEHGGIDLMGVEIDAGIGNRPGEIVDAVRGRFQRQ